MKKSWMVAPQVDRTRASSARPHDESVSASWEFRCFPDTSTREGRRASSVSRQRRRRSAVVQVASQRAQTLPISGWPCPSQDNAKRPTVDDKMLALRHFMRGPSLRFGLTIVHGTRWPPHRASGGGNIVGFRGFSRQSSCPAVEHARHPRVNRLTKLSNRP